MGKRIPMPAWPALLFLPLAAMAADPARTQAVPELPLGILARPLPRGEETGRVILQHGADEVPVYVRSVQPDSVDGSAYRIAFAALDADGDGFIDRDEAAAHPPLADEFNALDTRRRGRLDRQDLAGWLTD